MRKQAMHPEWGITNRQVRNLGGRVYLASIPDLSRQVLINSLSWNVGLPKYPFPRLKRVRKARVRKTPKPPVHATPRSVAKVERMMYLAERLAA